MTDALFDLDPPASFQMQEWDDGQWTPMEDGPAGKAWQPRNTPQAAIHRCIEWTGCVLIPAMRVLDLNTGEVIWQDTNQYPEAGDTIMPPWAPAIYDQVRAELKATTDAEQNTGTP